MTIATRLNKYNSVPADAAAVGVFDQAGNLVGKVDISKLNKPAKTPKYRIGVLSDVHRNEDREEDPGDENFADFRNALSTLQSDEHVAMICMCGDISFFGSMKGEAEYTLYSDQLAESAPTLPVYTCVGNHDARRAGSSYKFLSADAWERHANCRSVETEFAELSAFPRTENMTDADHTVSFYFTKRVDDKDLHFVFLSMRADQLSTTSADIPFWDSDIEYLGRLLDGFGSDMTFVFMHPFMPASQTGAGNFEDAYKSLGGEAFENQTQAAAIQAIIDAHPNSFWFSGHSHWRQTLQEKDPTDKTFKSLYCNASRNTPSSGFTVHVPSCAYPADSHYDETTQKWTKDYHHRASEGMVMDIYDDYVQLRGIIFKRQGEESYSNTALPIGTFMLKTSPAQITTDDVKPGEQTWTLDGGDTAAL